MRQGSRRKPAHRMTAASSQAPASSGQLVEHLLLGRVDQPVLPEVAPADGHERERRR